jgi:hypothetical protein
MTQLSGFFSLRSPRDLLEKLERDYARLEVADPASFDAQYAAFDFFVGANHLADWLKHSQGGSLSQHRAYQDGALVEHIANGAKHFRVDHHRTAKDTRVVDGVWAAKVWKLGVWARGVWREACLLIDLEDGTSVDVQVVAKRVLQHWRKTVP